jgi:hypothetical protein
MLRRSMPRELITQGNVAALIEREAGDSGRVREANLEGAAP